MKLNNTLLRGYATAGVFAFCSICAGRAQSQLVVPPPGYSLTTITGLGAGNLTQNGAGAYLWDTASNFSLTGAAITSTGSQSFTGLDSSGNTQTMSYSGTQRALADYGVLHAYGDLSVTNTYYNSSNPLYYNDTHPVNPNGSPEFLQSSAHAQWQDTLYLNKFADGIVSVKYMFHVDGSVDNNAFAFLGFTAGSDSALFITPGSSTHQDISEDWITDAWAVTNTSNPIGIGSDFGAFVTVDTNPNNTPEGSDFQGTSDFENTLTLTGIQFLDANGDEVDGVHFSSASGTHYNVLGGVYEAAAVPEPGSVAFLTGLLLTGITCVYKRRRVVR